MSGVYSVLRDSLCGKQEDGAQLITMDKAEGSDLKGIVYLRTVGEADDLVREIEECKSRKGHCVVIGASYIGMECGASVASNGIDGGQQATCRTSSHVHTSHCTFDIMLPALRLCAHRCSGSVTRLL